MTPMVMLPLMQDFRGVKDSGPRQAGLGRGPPAGRGYEPGAANTACKNCKGKGTIDSGTGFMRYPSTCPQCKGRGRSTTPCSMCGGRGVILKTEEIRVKIPPGVDNGTKVR